MATADNHRPSPEEVLRWALRYGEMGYRVVPNSHRKKAPIPKRWPEWASSEPDVIRAMWEKWPRAGISAVTGHGLGVVDVDDPAALAELGDVPDTATVRTPGGGLHLHLDTTGLWLPNNSAKRGQPTKLAPVRGGVDFRGDSPGHVPLPPSTNAAGVPYVWEREGPRARIPEAWAARLLAGRQNGAAPQPFDPPSRHDDDVTLAWKLVVNGVPEDVVLEALLARDRGREKPLQNIGRRHEIVAAVQSAVRKLGDDPLAGRVAQEADTLRVRAAARAVVVAEQLPPYVEPPAADWSATQAIARAPTEPDWLVQDWAVHHDNIGLFAVRKVGKSVMALNFAASMVDAVPFLGLYAVRPPDGTVLYFNYELHEDTFDLWMGAMGIKNTDALIPVYARSRSLPLWEPHVMERWAAYARQREAKVAVIDSAARAASGMVDNENDNAQVIAFTTKLDEFKEAAGIATLLIVHHMGKGSAFVEDQETGRGAGRWDDWPDELWYYRRGEEDVRSLRAEGRWANNVPIAIDYDPMTYTVRATGASRAEARMHRHVQLVVDTLAGAGGRMGTKALELATGLSKDGSVNRALREAQERGLVRREFADGSAVPLDDATNRPKTCVLTPSGAGAVSAG